MTFHLNIEFWIGTLISILLAYWGIWQSKRKKSHSSLMLVHRDWFPLVKTFVSDSEILKQLEYEPPNKENKHYYKGTLINNGNLSLLGEKNLKPLKISFGKKIQISQFNLIDNSSEISIKSSWNAEQIEINWDLLKPNETITFEAILTSSSDVETFEVLGYMKVTCRTIELDKVQSVTVNQLKNVKKEFLNDSLTTHIFSLMFSLFGLILIFTGVKSFFIPSGKLEYHLEYKGEEVELLYHSVDSINVKSKNFQTFLSLQAVQHNIKVKPNITIHSRRYFSLIFGVLISVFWAYRLFSDIKRDIKRFKLANIYKHLQYS